MLYLVLLHSGRLLPPRAHLDPECHRGSSGSLLCPTVEFQLASLSLSFSPSLSLRSCFRPSSDNFCLLLSAYRGSRWFLGFPFLASVSGGSRDLEFQGWGFLSISCSPPVVNNLTPFSSEHRKSSFFCFFPLPFPFPLLWVLGLEPRVSCMLSIGSTTRLHHPRQESLS